MQKGNEMKEKCEFCSRKIMFGKKDRTKLIGARPIVLGKGNKVRRLEVWLFGGELDDKTVLHIGVCDYGSVEDIFEMGIPIRFCPMCGERL
jgi:hypothetical protein